MIGMDVKEVIIIINESLYRMDISVLISIALQMCPDLKS